MHQQALATVLIRILGLSYVCTSANGILSGQLMMSLHGAYGEQQVSLMTVACSLVGIKCLIGILLMLSAQRIASALFKENEVINQDFNLSTSTLTQSALSLIGIYLLTLNLPLFIITSINWLKENAAPTGMPPIYGDQLARSSISIFLSLVLILKSDRIVRLLTRE